MSTRVTGDRQAPLLPLQIGHTGAKLNLEAVQKHQRSTKRAREAEHPPLRGGAARSSLKRTISADFSARFSQALSQTQELIQLKSRPRATTRADLHLARSDTVPSQAGGRECTARGEAGRLTPWSGRSPHLGSKVWGAPAQLKSSQTRAAFVK